jgi:hypothetical protein
VSEGQDDFIEVDGREYRVAGFACSFCGQVVESGEIDPVQVVIRARADRPRDDGLGIQTSWCHAACLRASGFSDLPVTTTEFWDTVETDDPA